MQHINPNQTMFTVIKRIEISASHTLLLPYRSKCSNLHGHNWIITVHCRAEQLDEAGMVADFTQIKERIAAKMDHQNLNEALGMRPDTCLLQGRGAGVRREHRDLREGLKTKRHAVPHGETTGDEEKG